LKEHLAEADPFEVKVTQAIDKYIDDKGLEVPLARLTT